MRSTVFVSSTLIVWVTVLLWFGEKVLGAAESEVSESRDALIDLVYSGYNKFGNFEFDATPDDQARALEIADELIAEEPNDLEVHAIKIFVLRKLGRSQEALQIYREKAEQFPSDPQSLFLLYEATNSSCKQDDQSNIGDEHFDEEKYSEEARPILDRVLELDPDYFPAWFEIIRKDFDPSVEGALDDIAALLDRLPPVERSSPDPYTVHNRRWRLEFAVATHYLFQKRTNDALRLFRGILDKYATEPPDPTRYFPFMFHRVYVNYGVCLYQIGKLEEADEAYRKAHSINPLDLFSTWNLALSDMKKEDYKAAKFLWKKCEQIDPNHRDLKGHMGLCLYKLGSEEEGISLMKEEALTQGGENQWTDRLKNMGVELDD